MKNFAKSFFFSFGANAVLFFISFAQPIFILVLLGAAATEILIGLLFLAFKETSKWSAGLLLAGGMALLIGLSICSTIRLGFH